MKLSLPFLHTEWREVVDAWQLDSWEAYRDVARLGRKTRLPEKQRVALWEVFARIRAELKKAKLTTLGRSTAISRRTSQGAVHAPTTSSSQTRRRT